MNDLVMNEQSIQHRIYTTDNIQFMLDSDLANMYGLETKRINEAVKNNPDKFPSDFYFELTKEEDENLRSKFSTFKDSLKNRKYAPKVFTEQVQGRLFDTKRLENRIGMINKDDFANIKKSLKELLDV